jgi:hypothetical protein
VIVNFLTVVYALVALLALALAVPAAVVGSRVAWALRRKPGPEARQALENRVYLVITLMTVGLSLRLVLVPLWFVSLSSLVSHVPGAMCLAGVHLLAPPWSFVASALKVVVPLVYGYWLVLNALDRRVARQPLLPLKLLLLAPVAALVLVESGLDLHTLASVEPRSVSCCSSLFDAPRTELARAVTESGWLWVWISAGLAAATTGLAIGLERRPTPWRRAALAAAASGTAATFLLALHAKLSSVLLHAPFHHCLFCLLRLSADVPVACGLIVIGAWLALVAALLPSRLPRALYRRALTRLLTAAVVTMGVGAAVLFLRAVLAVLS